MSEHKTNKVPVSLLLFGIVYLVLGAGVIWFGGVTDWKIICVIGSFIVFRGCINIASYTSSLCSDDDDGPHFYGPGGTVI